MNVYDFEDNNYKGDLILDFYFFCLKFYPELILYLFKICYIKFLYIIKKINKETMKNHISSFLSCVDDIDFLIEVFFNEKQYKLKNII